NCHIPSRVHHISGPLHHRSTILSALGLPFSHGFVFGNSRANSQWVTHPGSALTSFSLNFGVPTEPEASELPKGLVLGRDENIHLRITPLGDVRCYKIQIANKQINKNHITRWGNPICHISARDPTTSRARLRYNTILSALGPNHALTVLFLGTHTRTSQWVTHHGIALARTHLTSEFRWNPKPVSSQKASC
ncbi:hypothetical protein DVH24_032797, partial [Malus domestica]